MDNKNNSGKHSAASDKKKSMTPEKAPKGTDTENKKVKKNRASKILKIILAMLIVVLLVFVAIFGRYVIKNGGNVTQAFKEMFKDAVGDQDPIFILVMGISEDISAELTDTIMLIGYNPDTNQAFVLSIPRDTFIGKNESNAGGFDKINALYQKDPQKTISAVENITGIKIDHYVVVKTSVLVKIVDTLGGVYFDVPVNMNYDDTSQDLHIHLKKGYQKLNGDQAEQLVRFRHNNDYTSYPASYGDNDEGRTRTQREFLKVVAQQVISTRDIDKIKSIAKDVFDNLETNITWDKVVGYIPYAVDAKMDELEMKQLPGQMGIMNKLWFFKVNKQKTEELISGYIDKLGLNDAERKSFLIEKESNGVNSSSSGNTSFSKKSSSGNNSKATNNTNTNKTKNENSTTNTTSKNTTTNSSGSKSKSNTSDSNKTSESKNSGSTENQSSEKDGGNSGEDSSGGGKTDSGDSKIEDTNESSSSGGSKNGSGGDDESGSGKADSITSSTNKGDEN